MVLEIFLPTLSSIRIDTPRSARSAPSKRIAPGLQTPEPPQTAGRRGGACALVTASDPGSCHVSYRVLVIFCQTCCVFCNSVASTLRQAAKCGSSTQSTLKNLYIGFENVLAFRTISRSEPLDLTRFLAFSGSRGSISVGSPIDSGGRRSPSPSSRMGQVAPGRASSAPARTAAGRGARTLGGCNGNLHRN